MVDRVLELTAHLPEVQLAPGEQLVGEGTRTGSVWVLVSGSLEVRKSGAHIHTFSRPGSFIGEMAILLDGDHQATVLAAGPTTVRYAVDGRALLLDNPELILAMAGGMAERLNLVTAYLADLRNQYTGVPGIDMVATVLSRLSASTDAAPLQPGSRREPNPEY